MVFMCHMLTILTVTLPSFKVDCWYRPWKQFEFLLECRSVLQATPQFSDLPHQELVEGITSDQLSKQLSLSATELHSFWSWAPAMNYLSNPNRCDCHWCGLSFEKKWLHACLLPLSLVAPILGICRWGDSLYWSQSSHVYWSHIHMQ